MNWNRETLKGDFSLANNWFKDNKEKIFCIGLWLEIRSGYSTTTPRRKNTMLSPVNRCYRSQHQQHGRTFIVRRSCFVSVPKECCLLWAAETWWFHYGRLVSATIDSFEHCVHCEKNGQNTSKDMIKLFFFMTLGLISLKS